MGGRGSASGISAGNGSVVITRESEPNKQGYAYYMTGERTVVSNWDDEGNYSKKGFKTKEPVRVRFSSKDEAVKYAKKNKYKYLSF